MSISKDEIVVSMKEMLVFHNIPTISNKLPYIINLG
jgi:hypothetical protein